jgi:tetratricopeptide (TPR) repeat protein
MAQYQTEERAKLRRHWVEQAISLAMQNRWQDAVNVNRSIIELFPNDVDALNRLGRALTELGQYAEAREAYGRAVEIDQTNTIARRNLSRLSTLGVKEASVKAHEKVDPRMFIAETGKSGAAALLRPAPRDVLAKMTVGDQVYLTTEGRALLVENANHEYLGQVEPRLSQRLIDLIRGGNRYAAAIISLDDTQVRLIIRETYQDPSQAGKVAFPSKGPVAAAFRPYIKDTLVKYELDEEEEETLEEPEYAVDVEPEMEGAEPMEEAEFEEEDDAAEE